MKTFSELLITEAIIGSEVFEGPITIEQQMPAVNKTVLRCRFKDVVHFQFVDLTCGITFVECTFESGVVFDKCSSSDVGYFPVGMPSGSPSLSFERCTIKSFRFLDCDLCTNIEIANSVIDNLSFGDHNVNSKRPTNLTISETRIGNLYLLRSNIAIIHIYKSIIVQELTTEFPVNSIDIRLDLNDCLFQGKVLIQGTINEVVMEYCKFENEVLMYLEPEAITRSFRLRGCNFAKAFIVEGANRVIELIEVTGEDTFSGIITFIRTNIDTLSLSNIFANATINFQRSVLKTIEFSEYSNVGVISFLACDTAKGGTFKAINSDLAKTRFLGFNFRNFDDLTLSNSFLSEIICSSCEWFDDVQLKQFRKIRFYGKREVYRQLKQAAEKQGNRIQALEFQARELKAFRWEIASRQHLFTSDRLALLLGLTNGFGLNWLLPMGLLIGTTIIFYVLMIIYASPSITFTPAKSFTDVSNTLMLFLDRSEVLIQLFNPAHNLSHLFRDSVPTSVYWLDGIHRIIAAFLIVQIVSAFRKFFK